MGKERFCVGELRRKNEMRNDISGVIFCHFSSRVDIPYVNIAEWATRHAYPPGAVGGYEDRGRGDERAMVVVGGWW